MVEKEGNGVFNDTLNTFYFRSYGVGHMTNYHSDSERGNPLAVTTWATLFVEQQWFFYITNPLPPLHATFSEWGWGKNYLHAHIH